MQVFIGIAVAMLGAFLFFSQDWLLGAGCLLLGAAIINGARQDVWVSFSFGNRDDAGGDGGGDGD